PLAVSAVEDADFVVPPVWENYELRDFYNEDSPFPIVLPYRAQASVVSGLEDVSLWYRRDSGDWELYDMHVRMDDPADDELAGNPDSSPLACVADALTWNRMELDPSLCYEIAYGTFCFDPADMDDGFYEFAVVASNGAFTYELPGDPAVLAAATVDNETTIDRIDPVVDSTDVNTPTGSDMS
ncbi:MAG: hypothetical protein GY826_04120, partial [Fuerstiella sp.]|nr:hypothetical protein [Fuerstiella sp.]